MARNTKVVTVSAPGRDQGKHFLITEMSAVQGTEWAIRVFLALANANVDLPDGVIVSGMEGMVRVGLRALFKIPYEQARPLLADLMRCIQRVEDLRHPFPRALVADPGNPDGDDIQEIGTSFFLQGEVFEVLTGFSIAAWIAESRAEAEAEVDTSSTQTSTGSSEPSSAAA
jgi:hypothetical protein